CPPSSTLFPYTTLFRSLAAAGGALGVLLASWATSSLMALLSDGGALRALDVRTDVRTFMFALGVSFFTCLLFGIAPALWATQMRSEEHTSELQSQSNLV